MNVQVRFDQLQGMFPGEWVKLEVTYKSDKVPNYWVQVGEDLAVFGMGETFEAAYISLLERYIRDKRKANEK